MTLPSTCVSIRSILQWLLALHLLVWHVAPIRCQNSCDSLADHTDNRSPEVPLRPKLNSYFFNNVNKLTLPPQNTHKHMQQKNRVYKSSGYGVNALFRHSAEHEVAHTISINRILSKKCYQQASIVNKLWALYCSYTRINELLMFAR